MRACHLCTPSSSIGAEGTTNQPTTLSRRARGGRPGHGPPPSTHNVDLGWSGRGSTEETTVSVGERGGLSAIGAPVRPISGLEVVPVEPDPQPHGLPLPNHDLL